MCGKVADRRRTGVKGRQDKIGAGQDRGQYESQSRNPSKEIQNGGPVLFLRVHTKY